MCAQYMLATMYTKIQTVHKKPQAWLISHSLSTKHPVKKFHVKRMPAQCTT